MRLLVLLHIAAALPGLVRPMLGGRLLRHLEWFLGARARNKTFAIVFAFLFALALRTALLPIVPPGIPAIHDEYSYLLQADTFASGHLAMPAHPLWKHFETFHVLQHPTYASKFFPGQAAFLALGQKLLGHPWWGVVLSIATMCAAMVWCLQGFLPPGWAFLGGIITAVQFGTTHYWATSYWGGAVAAVGGCLAVGAAGRLLTAPSGAAGALFGLGAIILGTTRPFEGCVLCLVLLVWLALAARRRGGQALSRLLRRTAPPLLLVLAAGAGGMLFYNQAVTGDALTFPYVAYTRHYDAAYWSDAGSKPVPPTDLPREMQRYHTEWGYPNMLRQSSLSGRLASLPHRLNVLASLLFPIFFVPALLAPLAFCTSRPTRAPFLAVCAVLAASLLYIWSVPHYFAPALGLFAVLWLRVCRWLRTVRPGGRPVGLSLVRLLPLVLVCMAAVGVRDYPRRGQSDAQAKAALRAQIEAKLTAMGGRHLVVVTYGPHSNVHAEWVYNKADIDHAPVVWARDLGPGNNADLLTYYKDRRLWCAKVGAKHIDFGPCRPEGEKPSAP